MTWTVLAVLNTFVAAAVVLLMVTYQVRYRWWRSVPGRLFMAGLTAALLVTAGGIAERFGDVPAHDVLVAAGYLVGSVVLAIANALVPSLERRTKEGKP